MNAQLEKRGIHYMGGRHGPGIERLLYFPDMNIEISDEYNVSRAVGKSPTQSGVPSINEQMRSPIQLSEKAADEVRKLYAAFVAIEEAKKQFEETKDNFLKTEGGKEVDAVLFPSPRLTVRDILTEEIERGIREQFASSGAIIQSFEPIMSGYSTVRIYITFQEDAQASLMFIQNFKYAGFATDDTVYSYEICKDPSVKRKKCYLRNTDGVDYAPHLKEDHIDYQTKLHTILSKL